MLFDSGCVMYTLDNGTLFLLYTNFIIFFVTHFPVVYKVPNIASLIIIKKKDTVRHGVYVNFVPDCVAVSQSLR